jgi:hypothetical protein
MAKEDIFFKKSFSAETKGAGLLPKIGFLLKICWHVKEGEGSKKEIDNLDIKSLIVE